MTLLLLVGRALSHGFRPGNQHPLPIIGMKHALPTLALRLFLCETHIGEPLRVAEVQRAIGRTAPDLVRDGINHKPEAVFTSPYTLLRPLTLDNFLPQLSVDRFKLQGSLGDASPHVFGDPPTLGTRPPLHGRCR